MIQNFLPVHIGPSFSEKLTMLMIEPNIPLPKLQREAVASFVNSNFQSFICSSLEKNFHFGYLE